MTPLTGEIFGNLLSADQISNAAEAEARYGRNSLAACRRIPGAIRPRSHEEVLRCIEAANVYKVRLYPISQGHNWGYGGATPVQDDSVVMDLSEMKRILDFDGELGIVTLEPGVTQAQLSAFLIESNDQYLSPVHGGGPQCSIIGNALERGYGLTPVVDHFAAVTSLRAVLGSGEEYCSCLTNAA